MPAISVIVPVYKAESFLGKCVDSVLSQTMADIELILVDDGSPDKSGEICDSYALADERVRVIHRDNGGVSAARNDGIAAASGDYILFVDSDDYIDSTMCEKLFSALKSQGADTAACAHINLFPGGGSSPEPFSLPADVYGSEKIMDAIVRPLLKDRVREQVFNGYIWRYLFSRAIISENGIKFSGAYLEDELFLIEYFCCAKRLAVVSEPLYYYYQNPGSVTRRYLKDFEKTFLASFEAKRALVKRYSIDGIEGWESMTLWAGLLIAIGNEYAPGNPISLWEKRKNVIALCGREPFKSAIASGKPRGAGKRKQIVVDLVSSKNFTVLTLLYAVKNRGR
ncbi:MAG TPA: glycosyltransferase [Clostridiales bacterium]|jgi:glycosyltransferase EpsJ|nr:glycosyltransferase [Clostridiales bacterium]